MSERTPIIRYFTLPNGDKIMSLRESTLRAGLKAAGAALRNALTQRPGQGQDAADGSAAASDRPEAPQPPTAR